jgi:hypothetical protein
MNRSGGTVYMRFLFWTFVAVIVVSCGRGRVTITSPADNQQIQIGQTFQVSLDGDNYDGCSISIAGQNPGYQCYGGGSSPFICTMTQQGFGGGQMNGGCGMGTCTGGVVVQCGDNRDVRFVNFTQGGFGGGQTGVPGQTF